MSEPSFLISGQYIDDFNALTGLELPCGPIYQSPGVSVHVQGHHPNCVKYLSHLSEIISAPDYIGHNQKEPDSIELVKNLGENILVAVKLDKKDGYLYVASLYDISQGKIDRRLSSGRLKKFKKYD